MAFKYGRLPPDYTVPRLWAGDYMTTAVPLPSYPQNRATMVPSWPMYLNDTLGDCTIAEAAHAIGAWTVNSGQAGGEALFSDEAITQFYSLCGGYVPGNPSTDNGCVMSTVFADWTQTGITDTKGKLHTLQAYAQLADTSESFLNWGLKNFGSVHLGINCPQSAEDQFSAGQPWSYVQGSPVIGGHAVALQENQAPGEYAVVTWGALQLVEQDFFDHYLEEAWVALSYDWLTIHSNSITGLDVAQLVVDMGLLRTS